MSNERPIYSESEWREEAKRLFGDDPMEWRFKCPSCGYVAAVKEWRDCNAPEGAVAFSCIGRYTNPGKEIGDKTGGPCNYTLGGLLNFAEAYVQRDDGHRQPVFAFADTDGATP